MLDQYDVVVLPCDGFGASASGLIRISLRVSENKLALACQRIVKYVKTLKQKANTPGNSAR